MNLLSDDYKNQLMQKHIAKPWGGGGASWVPHLEQWRQFDGVSTVLDYGCGRHTFLHSMRDRHPHIEVREYDPGVPGFDASPAPADLVVCTDVLEHFEPAYLRTGLEHLASLTIKRAFFVIACTDSKSFLPDGRNTHLIVQPAIWWLRELHTAFGSGFSMVMHEVAKTRVVMTMERV